MARRSGISDADEPQDQQPVESPRPPRPKRPGRRQWDEATEAALLDLIHDGCTLEAAAKQVGWSVRTINNKRNASRSFDEAVTAALDMRGPLHAEKFDDDLKAEYLDRLREGEGRHAAARSIGIDPVTVWRHAERYDDFADAIRMAEREGVEEVESMLRKAALGLGGSGKVDTTAAIFILTNLAPDKWADRRNIRVGGEPGNPLRTQEVVEDPADLIARMLAEGGDDAANMLDRLAEYGAPDREAVAS